MSVKERLLPLLRERGGYLSGEEAAGLLGVSRNAVWKAVSALKADGYDIEAVTNRGYRLNDNGDILSAAEIEKSLNTLSGRLKIEVEHTVTSTNALLREKAAAGAPEGTVLAAAEQTAGRGRFTRSFFSPADSGVYLSVILRPRLSAENAALITTAAAVAVAEAAEELSGRKTEIKWVNDVLIDGKKICGILTEASLNLESGELDYAVLGIGLNAYEPEGGFPPEIADIAGAIFKERGAGLRSLLASRVLEYFFKYYDSLCERGYLKAYRERCIVIGREITVLSGGGSRPALALGVDESCRLHVKYPDGGEEYLSSGEISVRLS
ncbi:MAG: biotin--[acetyl-CoA-carboxylase] ligase [Acutalibacteraceae bacterium]